VLIILPNISAFPYPASGSPYSDITTTHFPNAEYLVRAIREWRTIPLWSTAIFSGYPFSSHPLSGLFYPIGWLALLFSLPTGFNILLVAHLVWGGLGMFILMRLEGRAKPSALFAGMAFACLPKVFAHIGAGHLSLIYALVWTPWLLSAHLVGVNNRSQKHSYEFLPGIILGLIFLADVRWAGFSIALYMSYGIAHSLFNQFWFNLKRVIIQLLLALAIAAPLLISFVEYTRLSTRSLLSAEDAIQYSLPILRIAGLILPDLRSNHEWVIYPGAMVCILTVVALTTRNNGSTKRYWGLVAAVSLFFSFGANLPILPNLLDLPVFDLLRVPTRALFLTGLSLCALAGFGIDAILGDNQYSRQRITRLALVGFSIFVIVFSLGQFFYFQISQIILLIESGLIVAGSIWLALAIGKKMPSKVWLVGLFTISLLDWFYLARMSIIWRESRDVFTEARSVAEFISEDHEVFRTYSPSYSMPQHTAIRYNLEQVDGVDPLQLTKYVKFMDRASGVPNPVYSVTLPPFASGKPDIDNKDYIPDARLLGLLNVRYVISAFRINSEGLVFDKQIGDIQIYRNLYQWPRAWIQDDLEVPANDQKEVEIISRSPNLVKVKVEGPGLLVLSEIDYPGWEVSVDGNPAKLRTFAQIFRSVSLDEGQHLVRFTYQPKSLYAGLGVWLVLCIGILAWSTTKLNLIVAKQR
jgi:hypothetical protein